MKEDAAGTAPVERRDHEWDDDGCCIHCGFDGAEWHWWRHSTYEGRAQPEAKRPPCKPSKGLTPAF